MPRSLRLLLQPTLTEVLSLVTAADNDSQYCKGIMSSSECTAFQVNGVSVLGYKDPIAKRPNETVARGYLVHGNQVSMALRIPDTLRGGRCSVLIRVNQYN